MGFFDRLSPDTQRRLYELAEELRVPAGERFIRAGDTDGDLFRVQGGSVEVVDSRAKPEVVLDVLGPGAVVGELGFIAGEPRSADVRASGEAVLLRWRRAALDAAMSQDPRLAAALYQAFALVVAERLRATSHLAAAVGSARGGDVQGARSLAEAFRGALSRAEGALRRGDSSALSQVDEGVFALSEGGGRMLGRMSPGERRAVADILRRELGPMLGRSTLGALALGRPPGREGFIDLLRHVERGIPGGLDPLGEALDGALLRLPTPATLRARPRALAALAGTAKRVFLLNGGSTALARALATSLAHDAELVCALDDAAEAEALDREWSNPRHHVVTVDVLGLALWKVKLGLTPRDLVLVHGLAEHMPDRLLGRGLAVINATLAPGGRLVADLLVPSTDAWLFGDLLGWPALRRSPEQLRALLAGLGELRLEPLGEAGVVLGTGPTD